ncbi:hypothetical protein IWW45_001775 [Coemansia sp. RSA 485]|nr:hypothetical protein IWW45_001775 [Coemansia sp. RSA 485]
MAPFSSSAAEVSLEFDDRTAESRGTGRYDVKNEVTRIGGRVLVKVSRSIAVNNVRVEFVGEETVYQRGWTSLGSSVSREIVRQRSTVHAGGTLAEGVHVFGFSIEVPGWVPSTVDRELCRIKYVVRGVVERSSLGTYLMGSQSGVGGGVSWVKEEEVECRRVRVARRLARRKKIDQSVGCPDGSCHVRFWGSVSRDVVKPGAQIKIDVVARTSDARYGLRLLVANLAEHVLCHVQAKGEERLTKKITNLVSCRLDGLGDSNSSSIEAARSEEAGSWGSRESPGARETNNNSNNVDDGDARGLLQLPRGVRKTRSRLAVLLRNTSPSRSLSRMASAQSTGAVNECDYSTARAQRSPPPLPQTPSAPAARSVGGSARAAQRPPSVVRQIRASHVIQVPYGLSQFSSEYVSREYRLMLVAEVAPLDDWEVNGNSVHTCDSARPAVAPYDAPMPMPPPLLLQGARKTSTSTVSSSSASAPASASASVCSLTRSTSPDLAASRAHRRHARSDATAQPQQSQSQQPQAQRWAVSEQASAIAGWQIDVVDHFDVRFDELVASSRSPVSMAAGPLVARSVARDPEIHAGPYTFEPPTSPGTASSGVHLGSVVSPTGTVTTLGTLTPSDQGSADEGVGTRRSARGGHGHHRRTSSGLVGFLMRGFRSSSSSLSPTVSPRIDHGSAQQQSVALSSSRGKHVRSVSNSSGADHLVRRSDAAHRQHYTHPNHSHHLHVPGSAGAEPSNSRVGEDGVIVMRPLQQHADVDERPPPQSAGAMLQRPLRSNSAPFGDQEASEPTTRKTQTSHGVPKGPVLRRRR